MRILFLVYHGFSEHSGISKKIHYQVKGLKENGHDVRLCYYDFDANGHSCRFVDGQVIKDYGMGKWAGLRQRLSYDCVYDYCLREKIEIVYARCFMNANPWLVHFFKKLKRAGVKAVTEIPTYPYDCELDGSVGLRHIGYVIDKHYREKLYRYMNAIVTFSDAEEIFGQRTIRISNGVDFDAIPLNKPSIIIPQSLEIHLIGVAEVHYWHGYDRLIAGMGEYYRKGGRRKVVFHIVGGIWEGDLYGERGIQSLIDNYGLNDNVVLHGQLFGDALTNVFNQCQFAIGSLARHRSGIKVIKTLKNREYATRGIPFVYSEQDSDFDQQPYVLKVPADESPINLQEILDFINHFNMKPEEIRKTVEHLTWKIQMQKVIDAII
jgi:glycosyltransferase involved in cell wall biosynthesis